MGIRRGNHLYEYAYGNPNRFVDPLGLYGTDQCCYYMKRCFESGGAYYCAVAPHFCHDVFPRYPDPDPSRDDDFEGWSRCTRQCLQDCDAAAFGMRREFDFPDNQDCEEDECESYPFEFDNPDPATDEFDDPIHSQCHAFCYTICAAWGVDEWR